MLHNEARDLPADDFARTHNAEGGGRGVQGERVDGAPPGVPEALDGPGRTQRCGRTPRCARRGAAWASPTATRRMRRAVVRLGWVFKKKFVHAPVNTPPSTTVCSSVRLDSTTAWESWRGDTTKERFHSFAAGVARQRTWTAATKDEALLQ